jgi:hypothetical protein
MAGNTVNIAITASDKASATLKGVSSQADKMSKSIKSAAVAVAGLAAAYVSLDIIKNTVESARQLGEAVHDMGEQTGASAEESSRLLFALKASGVESDKASTALGRFAKNMFAVTLAEDDGTKSLNTNQKILAGLGVTVTDTAGRMRPLTSIIMDLADKFGTMQDSSEKTAIVLSLFGKGGLPMLEFLNQGSAGIKELSDQADRLGLTLSGENVAAVHAYTVAQRKFGEALGGIKLQIGMALMPELTKLADWFIANQPQIRAFVDRGINALRGGLIDLWAGIQANRQTFIDMAAGIAMVGKAMIDFGSWVIGNKAALVAALVAIGVAMMWASGPVGIAVGIIGIGAALGVLAGGAGGAVDPMKRIAGEVLFFGRILPETEANINRMTWALAWNQEKVNQYNSSPAARQFYQLAGAAAFATSAISSVLDLQSKAFQVTPQPLEYGPFDVTTSGYDSARQAAEDAAAAIAGIGDTAQGAGFGLDDFYNGLENVAGGAADAVKELTAEQQALIDLAAIFNSSGLSIEQYNARLALVAEAMKDFDLTAEQLVATFNASGLSVDDFASHLSALTQLKDLEQQATDATDAVDDLSNAFNGIFSRPTKEDAAMNLELAKLKEERAQRIADAGPGANVNTKKLDKQIQAIEDELALRRAHTDVLKAEFEVANELNQTIADQDAAAQILTSKMGDVSAKAVDLQIQFYLSALSLQNWSRDLAGWMDAARESLTGGVPGYASGGIVSGPLGRPQLAVVHGGEEVIPAGRRQLQGGFTNYGVVNVSTPGGGQDFLQQLERQLR